jgi:hypothetical protein
MKNTLLTTIICFVLAATSFAQVVTSKSVLKKSNSDTLTRTSDACTITGSIALSKGASDTVCVSGDYSQKYTKIDITYGGEGVIGGWLVEVFKDGNPYGSLVFGVPGTTTQGGFSAPGVYTASI